MQSPEGRRRYMKTGQTIGNHRTRETLTMLIGEEENGGVEQLYRVKLPPHRLSPPLHYHLSFKETFTVEQGILDIYLGRERSHMRLKPEESVTAHVGQPHTFANDSDEPCTMTVNTRPAGGVVRAFQLAYAVANDGAAGKDGLPKNPLLRLRFIQISQGFLPGIPLTAQKLAFGAAGLLAKVTGLEKRVQRYLAA
jgi:mannose-6-phosphate isomerase-like protein (cupin superfamily)